jgi:hypothetical protein
LSKKYGYSLIILGIALIAIGVLNVAGYLSFQVVDTTPPTILYTYPVDKMTYKPESLNEIVIYAKDTSDIVSASYTDNKIGLKTLTITPYINLKHPLITEGWKFPDVNYDGRVNQADIDLVNSYYGKESTDPDWDTCKDYDLNFDGKINIRDIGHVANYYGTVTFAVALQSAYSVGEKISFTFTVLDSFGNTAKISGLFDTGTYDLLLGSWKINNSTVSDNMFIELSNWEANVTFICEDKTVSPQNVTVKVYVNDKTFSLTYTGNYIWQSTIEMPSGHHTLILEASAQTKINKIAVTVKTPELPTFTIGHALTVAGVILLIGGIIIKKKEEDIVY